MYILLRCLNEDYSGIQFNVIDANVLKCIEISFLTWTHLATSSAGDTLVKTKHVAHIDKQIFLDRYAASYLYAFSI